MSKYSNRYRDDFDSELDERIARQQLREHRKDKRLKNALRGRRYEELYDDTDY